MWWNATGEQRDRLPRGAIAAGDRGKLRGTHGRCRIGARGQLAVHLGKQQPGIAVGDRRQRAHDGCGAGGEKAAAQTQRVYLRLARRAQRFTRRQDNRGTVE